jgi:ABC-type molybdate transport system substrate-binding protein
MTATVPPVLTFAVRVIHPVHYMTTVISQAADIETAKELVVERFANTRWEILDASQIADQT